MRVWLVQTVAPLAFAALVVAGVVALGRAAHDDLRKHERYALSFDTVQCEPPPGVGREEFLREVQYEAELPDRLDRFDAALALNLKTAFLRHPWVESVERIEVSATGPVRLRLGYRTPVLAVRGFGSLRVLDRNGILLPRGTASAGLPLFRGKGSRITGPTGTVWGATDIVAAAWTADFLRPQRERLGLESLEVVGGEVILQTSSGSRVLWGNAPGRERTGEATAVLKRDRLLNQLARVAATESPGSYEYDVRPASGSTQKVLGEGVQVGSRGQP